MGTGGARAAFGASNARGPVLVAFLQGAASLGLLALSSDPQRLVWQPPAAAGDLLGLSRIGALAACALYLAASAWAVARTRRPLAPVTGLAVLAIPYAFNWLWILTSPGLIAALGRVLVLGAEPAPWAAEFLGRTLVLAVFNVCVFIGVGLVMDRRSTRGVALHALLLASAAFAAATPWIADAAASPVALGVGGTAWRIAAVAAAALAQAGLWVETHLVTGALLDAIRGRRPTRRAAYHHAGEGLARGAVFGGFFMALIQAVALALDVPAAQSWLQRAPLLGVALAGALLFAFVRTIVESFDGSRALLPPARRERARAGQPPARPRGRSRAGPRRCLGAASRSRMPSAPASDCWSARRRTRASTSSATSLSILRGRRQRLQSWRVYALGALLGGVVGGALGWYFDASQLDVVIQKFRRYAGVAPRLGAAAARLRHLSLVQQVGRHRSRRRRRAA